MSANINVFTPSQYIPKHKFELLSSQTAFSDAFKDKRNQKLSQHIVQRFLHILFCQRSSASSRLTCRGTFLHEVIKIPP